MPTEPAVKELLAAFNGLQDRYAELKHAAAVVLNAYDSGSLSGEEESMQALRALVQRP